MRLVSWNVNGVRAVAEGPLRALYGQLGPDVICLQETKAQQSQSELELAGYEEHWNSAEKKGYSGTAIFTKTRPRHVTPGLPDDVIAEYQVQGDLFGDPNAEGRVLTAEYDAFSLVTVYTPNAKDDLGRLKLRARWDPAFLAYVKSLGRRPSRSCSAVTSMWPTRPTIWPIPKSNAGKKGFTDEERKGFQNFLDAGFVDTFRMFHQGNGFYTWWSHFANARTRNVGWRIDYFLVSADLVAASRRPTSIPTSWGATTAR
jgi:exodeoxyribonuclease-3